MLRYLLCAQPSPCKTGKPQVCCNLSGCTDKAHPGFNLLFPCSCGWQATWKPVMEISGELFGATQRLLS